ncbi:hypothetical protein ACIRRH_41145 [Kitasatospora sp. NPDC101235]|uniref:hypothetical protein n=1 Tax=Kitasatospora sp. NPDC101235 TaxID=3364101 RepID=UPI0037F3C392
MTKTEAIAAAAREVLAHGGPDCLTDRNIALRAVDNAMAMGVTEDEILAAAIAAAEGRLTQLQHAFIDEAHDRGKRHTLAHQIRKTRDEIARLYELLPA